jgi:hypothetical protein
VIFSFQNPRVFMLSSSACDIVILESKGFHGYHHLSLEQNKKHHHTFCSPFL